MKIFSKIITAAGLTVVTSCSTFLDVNTNPNNLTAAAITPNSILAQALATTAANYTGALGQNNYNSYASFVADYWGKSGVVSGYSEEQTYIYSNSYYQGLWNGTYDNLNDYAIIQTQGMATGYPNHAAIARIMKVYNFQLLVDEYGDIPYKNALQGAANLTPTYDKAQDIYKDFVTQLDGAIADINAASAVSGVRTVGAEDIVFGGNMTQWKQFANSLKLRVLLRESQTADATLNAYVKTQLATLQSATDGFITSDVVAQPNYAQSAGQQNPFYTRYGFTASGANATEQLYQLPTNYIINQYVNNNDPRVVQLYTIGSRTTGGVTTSGYIGTDAGERSPPSFNAPLVASRFLPGGGILKGYNAPTVLMLLADQLFSQAEAKTRGLFTGGDATAKVDFQNGIQASFLYFYRPAAATPITLAAAAASTPGVSQYNAYIAANLSNPLVNYDLATTSALGKQSVIIYQKYLAMNSVASTEAWDDYRRTAQPKIQASLQSASTRADKLPTRLLYPLTEVSTNASNTPVGITQFTPIFWDVVD